MRREQCAKLLQSGSKMGSGYDSQVAQDGPNVAPKWDPGVPIRSKEGSRFKNENAT